MYYSLEVDTTGFKGESKYLYEEGTTGSKGGTTIESHPCHFLHGIKEKSLTMSISIHVLLTPLTQLVLCTLQTLEKNICWH